MSFNSAFQSPNCFSLVCTREALVMLSLWFFAWVRVVWVSLHLLLLLDAFFDAFLTHPHPTPLPPHPPHKSHSTHNTQHITHTRHAQTCVQVSRVETLRAQ